MTMTKNTKLAVVCLLLAALPGGCAFLAVETAPVKQATPTRLASAEQADVSFWEAFHGGDYERIAGLLDRMTAAYLENPGDPITAAHIGWLHIWRLAERRRLDSPPATITDDAVLARKYFDEAVSLNPQEARYLGFLASSLLAEGKIHHDEGITRQGYFTLLRAVRAWPEFNLFTAGYVLAGEPAQSARYREAIDDQWQNIDACINTKIDRGHPDFSPYLRLQTGQGVKRVCWNSPIAPHNFEGFFLNLGDMLVKAGDWQTARQVYANARLSPDYAGWKFRGVLEARIVEAETNRLLFSAETPSGLQPMMHESDFACMACHQT